MRTMRELKYRAWCEGDKEMFIVTTIDENHIKAYSPTHMAEGEFYDEEMFFPRNSVVLMQYTGLKDKDGKEIYEGDIVRGEDWGGSYKTINGVVEFVRGGFRINKLGLRWFIESTLEILGNIYENPELLDKLSSKDDE